MPSFFFRVTSPTNSQKKASLSTKLSSTIVGPALRWPCTNDGPGPEALEPRLQGSRTSALVAMKDRWQGMDRDHFC